MEFIYKLILVDRLFVEENWTAEDNKITMDHYNYLVSLKKENRLILAGKTSGLDLGTYGIVIFTADSLEHAKETMKNDPAIENGIMRGTLNQYDLALFNSEYKK